MGERSTYRVLIVEDEPDMAATMKDILAEAGYHCVVSYESKRALQLVEEEEPHIVLTDLKMPQMDGIQLLERIKREQPNLPVIIVTGYATVHAAVETMKKGASDFLAKPFSPDELIVKVEKSLKQSRLLEENLYLRRERDEYGKIVGKSPAIMLLLDIINKVGPTDSRVLVSGKSGTGKELVARAIHQVSDRRERAFFAINCAALTESLLESELFGHERGAFTGAIASKKGVFEMADGGTLFLDEVGDTSPAFQAKLLRVVEVGEFKRVGGNRPLNADVRIISSTNRDLKHAVASGTFREDLFYRLSVVQIHLPPLRERKEDIPLLVDHFLVKCFSQSKKRVQGITPDALDLLLRYPWPGNIRELENAVERATLMASGEQLTANDFVFLFPPESDPRQRKGTLEDLEKELIERTLVECSWNKTLTAKRMGISRAALYEKALRLSIHLNPAEYLNRP